MIVSILISIGLSLLSAALAPKPKIQSPEAGKLDIPTAAAGDDLPVYFGTVWEKNPKVVFYGNPRTRRIRSDGGKK